MYSRLKFLHCKVFKYFLCKISMWVWNENFRSLNNSSLHVCLMISLTWYKSNASYESESWNFSVQFQVYNLVSFLLRRSNFEEQIVNILCTLFFRCNSSCANWVIQLTGMEHLMKLCDVYKSPHKEKVGVYWRKHQERWLQRRRNNEIGVMSLLFHGLWVMWARNWLMESCFGWMQP